MRARTRMPYRPDSTANFPQAVKCLTRELGHGSLGVDGCRIIVTQHICYHFPCNWFKRLLMATTLQTPAPAHELKPYKSLENDALTARIQAVRKHFGPQLVILGHHYQQDEVIALSDWRGDSYGLSQHAADSSDCRFIVFCGVHFMAETADILANRPEKLAERDGVRIPVILPDLAAGCSMADMAGIHQIEDAWDQLGEILDTNDITPVTYINSAASLKAFVGRHGGIVCTSSNAKAPLKWSFARTGKVMFFPDQHLGRNTSLGMGITLDQMPVWDPYAPSLGGSTEQQLQQSKV